MGLLQPREAYFWATHSGAELDLLVFEGARRLGFEFKCTEAPRVTRSMHVALADLRLSRLSVVHPGSRTYPMAPKIEALSINQLARLLR